MKLPIHLPLKKKELPSFYLALLLREEKATAVIFEEVEGKVQVVGKHEEHFKESIEAASVDEFLNTLDKAISIAESSLPKDVETQKTIFGLKETWVEETKIKKEYLSKLKKASDALGLSPIGFLVIHEAIAHLLQKEEGAPVSAILIEAGKRYEVLSLLRAGRIVETHRAKIEDSITQTSDRLLHHFSNPQVLPARIILLNGDANEDLQQAFISHTWSKSLPFLHVPQITVLEEGFDAKAMLFGAATQMGFDVLGDDLEKVSESSDFKMTEKSGAEEEEATTENEDEEEDEERENERHEEENFGFVVGKDIRRKKAEPKALKGDNIQLPPATEKNPIKLQEAPVRHVARQTASLSMLLASSEKLFGFLQKFSKNIKLPHNFPAIPNFPKTSRKLLLIPALFVLLIIGLLWYIFGLSADVTLLANAQKIEKKQDVALAEGSSTDLSSSTIGITSLTTDESGNVSENATGKKQVGDKAKGTVTLYNISDSSQTLSAGTTIVSNNGLKFTLDKDVQIASGSSDPINPQSGTAQDTVTASDIGPEYNLPSGIKFSITGGSTDLAAKNDNAFSGGTKKDVTVVSKDDINKAISDLEKNLESKAKDDITNKILKDSAIVGQFTDETVSGQKSSKDVGDEASSFTLSATVTFKAATYKTKDAQDFANSLLKEDNQNGSLEDISYSFDNVSNKNDNLTASFTATSALLPKIDEKTVAQEIAGKSFTQARSILTRLPQIDDFTVKLHPNIFFLPKSLPKISSHIHITVAKQ